MKTQPNFLPALPIEEAALQAIAQKMGAQISHVVCAAFVELLVLLREQEKQIKVSSPRTIPLPFMKPPRGCRSSQGVEHQQGAGLSVDPKEGD